MAALGHHSFFVSDHGYDDVDLLSLASKVNPLACRLQCQEERITLF